jgi:hypothetical protein
MRVVTREKPKDVILVHVVNSGIVGRGRKSCTISGGGTG